MLVSAAQPARKIATRPRNVSAIRFFFIAKETDRARDADVLILSQMTSKRVRVLLLMKLFYFALLAAGSLTLAGCVTETTKTREVQTDQTTTREHTQSELRKTGESQTGPALEKVDPAVTMSGPR